jgi:hypothetical protein
VEPRDDGCSKVPNLCTDAVLLGGYQTTLTYLCPEIQSPTATVTVTSTTTRTVTGSAASISSSEHAELAVSTSGELTTTMTVQSTMQVTVTETVVKATSSFFLTPAIITASYTAIPLSAVKPTWSEFKNTSSVAYSSPLYTNGTFSHSGYVLPTLNVMREGDSTKNVTTTGAAVTATGTGMAGQIRVSFSALFLGVMAVALML